MDGLDSDMKNHSHLPFFVALAAATPLASAQEAAVESTAPAPKRAPSVSPRAAAPTAPAPAQAAPADFVAPDGAVEAPVMPRTLVQEAPQFSRYSDADLAAMEAPSFDIRPDRTRLYFDEQHGVHWVRGRSFKASASADGFTFIPFLGSKASQNWPVQFRLAEATVGGTPLALDASAKVELKGADFTLDRGPVDVEYQVEIDSVEQLFHIERGALEGEIAVTLDVDTELFGAPMGGGLRFDGPEGGVDYGSAIAFDATGATVEVPVQYEAGTLRLTVPAAFVAAAVGDITIDPVVSTFAVDTVSGDQTDVDTAYTIDNDAFIFVYEDTFSGTDTDIYTALVDSGGTPVDERYMDSSADSWVDPEVAVLNGDSVALVVATQLIVGGDDPIQGRIYDTAANLYPAPAFEVADTNVGGTVTWSNARPDVGGTRSGSTGNEFLVVWERAFSTGGRAARRRTVDAAGNLGSLLIMGPGGSTANVSEVRVSESTGDVGTTNVWNVCFTNEEAGEAPELWACQFNADGSTAEAPQIVLSSSAVDYASLDISDALVIDGNDPAYVIVYDDFSAGDADVTAVICRGNSLVNVNDVNLREHAILGRNQNLPRIATTFERFVIGYTEQDAGVWTTYVTTLDLIEGNQLAVAERRRALVQTSEGNLQSLGMASRWSGGSFSRWVGFGYQFLDTANSDQDVTGAVFEAFSPVSPAYQYCDGTVNSTGDRGFMRLIGSRSAGTSKTAVGEALPANQFCLLISGSGSGIMPALGGGDGTLCLGGSLGRYNSQLAAADAQGVVDFTIDPANIPSGGSFFTALPGDFYQFQIWHRDVNSGGPTSNLTNAVTILFN